VEHDRDLRDFLVTSTKGLGFSLTDHQIQQFLLYLSQLQTWNRTINLTSITDACEIISKHFVDSLTGLSAFNFPFQGSVVDIGSGGGFPGVPLKIVRDDLRLILIEPSTKKCSFLRSIVGALKLSQVTVFTGNLQQYAEQGATPVADVMVIRALRLDAIETAVARVLMPHGRLLLYGTGKGTESHSNAFRVESTHHFTLPLEHGHRVITVLVREASA
jgi:16S rRNA (guanine527-N7)-methyltransferase